MGVYKNILADIINVIREASDEGFGISNSVIARTIGCDYQTSRDRLKELISKNMIQQLHDPGGYYYALPGRNVIRRPASHVVHAKKEQEPILTKETLRDYINKLPPGQTVEYIARFTEDDDGGRAAYIQRCFVRRKYKHIALLSNGHTCRYVELYQWFEKKMPIGNTEKKYRRIETWRIKKANQHK